jgi:hypothetical protein
MIIVCFHLKVKTESGLNSGRVLNLDRSVFLFQGSHSEGFYLINFNIAAANFIISERHLIVTYNDLGVGTWRHIHDNNW